MDVTLPEPVGPTEEVAFDVGYGALDSVEEEIPPEAEVELVVKDAVPVELPVPVERMDDVELDTGNGAEVEELIPSETLLAPVESLTLELVPVEVYFVLVFVLV